MPSPYNDIVLEHSENPRNTGRIENPDGKATEGSPACGDMVSLYLMVDPETKIITDIKFESYGCASNIATGSIITELAKGKTIEEAKKITWKEASDALGGLPKIKAHCSVLAVEVLRSAILNYEEKHGLITSQRSHHRRNGPETPQEGHDPIKGLDMVATHLVKEIDIKDGVVRILIDLPADHQFANSIKEDALEKIESLWDIDKAVVEFTD